MRTHFLHTVLGLTVLGSALVACGDDSSGSGGGSGTGGDAATSSTATGTDTTSTTTTTTTATTTTTSTGGSCSADVYQDPTVNACGEEFCCDTMTVCAETPENCFDPDGNLLDAGEALEACMITNACFPPQICTTGIQFTGTDPEIIEYAKCLSDECCDAFLACTGDGDDVQGCLDCLNGDQENYDLCIEANDCAAENCGQGMINVPICDSGLIYPDPIVGQCLNDNCCDEFTACTGDGSEEDINACIDCFNAGGGAICDAAVACGDASCAQAGGVCDSGIALGDDAELNACASESCCDEFNACTDSAADVQACIDCFDAGGGALCDAAGACLDANCGGEGGGGAGGAGGGGGAGGQ